MCLISDPSNIRKVILKTHFDGFDIIPANLAIQDCDLMLPNEKENNHERLGSSFMRLSESLKIIKNDYDVILIDCGPNLGLLTLNAIIACDGMIIPIPPSMNDYSSFIMYTATLRNMFRELSTKKLEYLRILLSKHKGSNEALQMENMMREQFGRYILPITCVKLLKFLKQPMRLEPFMMSPSHGEVGRLIVGLCNIWMM